MKLEEYIKIIEAILFASDQPMSFRRIAAIVDLTESDVKSLIEELDKYYTDNNRGIKLYFFKDKVQIGSNPFYTEYLKKMIHSSKNKGLSDAAMEVLSIVAYKQPITKSEIEYIRGINSDRLIYHLINRMLIEEKGRLEKIGRPKTYGTTDLFLRNFDLASLKELPEIDYDRIEE
jgi:segregation and condensation protein B